MSEILVVAPHPDDETLGCGGTLLRHAAQGDKVHWLIVTEMKPEHGFTQEQVESRCAEIREVARQYGFSSVHALGFSTAKLDTAPLLGLVAAIEAVFKTVRPEAVYLPYPGDVHSDHRIVFDAAAPCTKTFRFPWLKRVLAYETISETDLALNPGLNGFRPNVYVCIDEYVDKKIEIMKQYTTEFGEFPFPRSEEALRALAALRGAAAGCRAAESFMLLKEIL